MANKYDATKVKNVGLLDGPNGGMALVVEFEHTVEVDGKYFAFPLEAEHVNSLFKILTGRVAGNFLERIESPIIRPGPIRAFAKP